MHDAGWPYDRAFLERVRLSRDSRFDGRVYIAIRTTGVYCRPICPSPTSRPENVEYYPSAAAAASVGYRPCRRCRPEAAPGSARWQGTSTTVQRALRLIEEGMLDEVSVEGLAERLGVGSRHLTRLFQQHVGTSPAKVAQTARLQFAKRMLEETVLPISQVAFAVGYRSLRRFNDAFKSAYDAPPRTFRSRRSTQSAASSSMASLTLSARPPFDWPALKRFLAMRVLPGVERCSEEGYERLLRVGGAVVHVQLTPHSDCALRLAVGNAPARALLQIASAARRFCDLDAMPMAVADVLARDGTLAEWHSYRPGLRIPGSWDAFECAVRALLGETLVARVDEQIARQVVTRCCTPVAGNAHGLTHTFLTPLQLATNPEIVHCGLPPERTHLLRAFGAAVHARSQVVSVDVDDILDILRQLRGVPEIVLQLVALRSAGDPDVFALEEESLPLAVPLVRGASALRRRIERWRPWRGYAALSIAERLSPEEKGLARVAAGSRQSFRAQRTLLPVART